MTPWELDHLVVACRDLEQGDRWAQEVLGVSLAPGGRHALMGTHNRLLSLGDRRYLECIAIDPESEGPQAGRRRWFDLDDPALQAQLGDGPALVHAVVRVNDLDAALAAWGDAGFEAATATRGALSWRIAVRSDGCRIDGRPTLIQWGAAHPCDRLPPAGVQLLSFDGRRACLQTPKGRVDLAMLA